MIYFTSSDNLQTNWLQSISDRCWPTYPPTTCYNWFYERAAKKIGRIKNFADSKLQLYAHHLPSWPLFAEKKCKSVLMVIPQLVAAQSLKCRWRCVSRVASTPREPNTPIWAPITNLPSNTNTGANMQMIYQQLLALCVALFPKATRCPV